MKTLGASSSSGTIFDKSRNKINSAFDKLLTMASTSTTSRKRGFLSGYTSSNISQTFQEEEAGKPESFENTYSGVNFQSHLVNQAGITTTPLNPHLEEEKKSSKFISDGMNKTSRHRREESNRLKDSPQRSKSRSITPYKQSLKMSYESEEIQRFLKKGDFFTREYVEQIKSSHSNEISELQNRLILIQTEVDDYKSKKDVEMNIMDKKYRRKVQELEETNKNLEQSLALMRENQVKLEKSSKSLIEDLKRRASNLELKLERSKQELETQYNDKLKKLAEEKINLKKKYTEEIALIHREIESLNEKMKFEQDGMEEYALQLESQLDTAQRNYQMEIETLKEENNLLVERLRQEKEQSQIYLSEIQATCTQLDEIKRNNHLLQSEIMLLQTNPFRKLNSREVSDQKTANTPF